MIALFRFLYLFLCGVGSFLGIFLIIQKFRGKENPNYAFWAAIAMLLILLGVVIYEIFYYSGWIL